LLSWRFGFDVDWQRSRANGVEVEALAAVVNKASDDIDKAIAAEVPADLNGLSRHLERFNALTKRNQELTALMQDSVLKAKGDAGTRFREAVSIYSKKVELIGPKLNEVRKRIDEIRSNQP
jgi:hypothetical protein